MYLSDLEPDGWPGNPTTSIRHNAGVLDLLSHTQLFMEVLVIRTQDPPFFTASALRLWVIAPTLDCHYMFK